MVNDSHREEEKAVNAHDPLGAALLDFDNGVLDCKIEVHSPEFEVDYIDVSYLNRSYTEMPNMEQFALNHCKGKTLDVGCGSGAHLKHLRQIAVDADGIDISAYATQRLNNIGINARQADFFNLKEKKYDTLLMLMNGLGIAGTYRGVYKLLAQAKNLLKKGGQLIFDSSDLSYLFDLPPNDEPHIDGKYFGEIEFTMKYLNVEGKPFSWLYLDEFNLQRICSEMGFDLRIAHRDEHYGYLAIVKFN